jgi:hypothetical protein
MGKSISIEGLLQAAAAKGKSHAECLRFRYPLINLRQFLGRETLPLEELNRETVEGFATWLVGTGRSAATVEQYRKGLRALLLRELPEEEALIREAFARKAVRPGAKVKGLTVDNVRLIAKKELTDRPELTQARDLFLFGLYCGGMDYQTLRGLTREMTDEMYLHVPDGGRRIRLNANLRTILAAYEEETDPLLFPFCRRLTEARYVKLLADLAVRLKMPRLKERNADCKAWVAIAEHLDIGPEVMAAVCGKEVGVLTHFYGTPCQDQKRIDRAVNSVSIAVADPTEHWYAMRLRSGRTPEDVMALIFENEAHPFLRSVQTYYPMRDVRVKVRGRWTKEAEAYIKGVLFFRCKPGWVQPLFSVVRDVAWIYRQTNALSAPYCIIPQVEMVNFQRAVACFTSDVEVDLVHTDGLEIGRRVRLLSGPFEGCEGVIENEEEGGALRSFLIRFTSDNALKVKLSVDETNIEPIE